MEKKIEKKFWVFQIITFELAITNYGYAEQDTCNRRSICQQTPLRFHLTLGATFPKSTSLRMREKLDKTALMKISEVFGTFSHVDCQSVFWNDAFKRVL